ncbi:nucleotidyltransferase family protein [Bacteroidota bacterium]
MIRKALILAAGVGSRLRPLTDSTPKALLEYRGKTMLEHVVIQLATNGIRDIVINIHHHADMIIEFVRSKNNIEFSDERDLLMDTGGAIIKARRHLQSNGPFLVHNIDIFSNLDLKEMLALHEEEEALATLAVRHRKTSRNLLIDGENYLCGWRNNDTGEQILVREKSEIDAVAFSGIHILNPQVFEIINRSDPFSIIKAYLELAENYKILTYSHNDDIWTDMAHPELHL